MAKGISIHIGLNSIDPIHYGTNGQLRGCENDAKEMLKIATKMGYTSTMILTKDATTKKVLTELLKASQILNSGDILFLTYSGHGSRIIDTSGEEEDNYDETWCLYDRMLIDDELNNALSKFKYGVRVIVLSDSCHSGTVTKEIFLNGISTFIYEKDNLYKCLDQEIAQEARNRFSYLYDGVKFGIPKEIESSIQSSVLLISGCQDNQLSQDGLKNGVFTSHLVNVWADGNFEGNYKLLHRKIVDLMPATQSPNYFFIGISNSEFENQKVFSINSSEKNTNNETISNENERKISWKIDLDDTILCKFSEDELCNYIKDVAVNPMVDGYKKFKNLSNEIIFTSKGGEITADIRCDSHGGGCDIRVGGSIRF